MGRAKRKSEVGKPAAQQESAEVDLEYIHPQLRALALPLESVQPDPRNENRHDAQSIRAIAGSLKQFGQRTPLTANSKTGWISKGNGTWQAAKSLGWEYIAVVGTEDDDATHTAYRIADNRVAQFSDFDEALIQEGLALIKENFGELHDELLLADLEGETSSESKEVEVTPKFGLYVELENEAAQQKLFDELKRKKHRVRICTI